VKLASTDHSLVLREGIVTTEEQHDLDVLGVAKTAREEKIRARDEELRRRAETDARMAYLYRKLVLKEPDQPSLIQIQTTAPAQQPVEEQEEIGAFGD
jgi:hypothetical protein